MKAFLLPALLLLATPAACEKPQAASGPHFPEFTNWVVDQADLLTPAQEAKLSAQAAALQKQVGPQFAIVTVKTLEGRSIVDYSVQLGRTWGVGSKARNDGLLLVVAPNERKARIEVGYGLEKRVTDPFAAKVMREDIIPRFQEGKLAEGIEAGSARLIERLRSNESERQIAVEDGVVS